QRAHGGAARLSQQQCRSRVGVHEDFFQGRYRRVRALHDLAYVVQDDLQPACQRQAGRHDDGAAGHIAQASALGVDDAKAGAPEAGIDAQDAHQWRKCRAPVSTIAIPRSLAAAITSSSRTLPPGWMTQVAPASATTSRPSRKGKKASEATAEPC